MPRIFVPVVSKDRNIPYRYVRICINPCPAGRAHCAWGGRSHAFFTCLGDIDCIGPAVCRDIDLPTNGRANEDDPFKTGIHATKRPHQAAQKSTSTGSADCRTSFSKLESFTSVTC